MSKLTNTYVLTSGSVNPVWQLRHKDVYVDYKDGDGKNAKVRKRKIRYVKGHPTFWDDELPVEAKTTAIDLKDGKYEADKNDSVLNEYLQIHPEFNKKFKLLDPEADAEAILREKELIDDAKARLREMDADKMKAVAITIFGDRTTRSWGEGTIKLQLHEYIEDAKTVVKDGLTKPQFFLEVIDDPRTQMVFFVTEAIRENILQVSEDKTSVRWTDGKGVIIPVASGQDPIRTLADFLLEKDGKPTRDKITKALA